MSFTAPRKRPLAFVLTLAVVAAAAAGIGYAAVPDSTGVIQGCRANKDGSLRIIDSGPCSSKENAIKWTRGQAEGGRR
jgi:hypothetical protein